MSKPCPVEPELLSPAAAAAFLGSVDISTLEKWRADGRGPAFVRLGARMVKYPLADLRAFVAALPREAPAETSVEVAA